MDPEPSHQLAAWLAGGQITASVWVLISLVLLMVVAGLLVLSVILWRQLLSTQGRLWKEWSARAEVERALSDKEQRLQTIFESQLECVKLHDANGTILTMNQAGIARLGARCAAQVVGTSVYSFIAPEHHERYQTLSASVFQGNSDSMEFRLCCAAGNQRLFETHVVPMRDSSGTILAALALTRDITDRRNAEERAQRHLSDLARVARITSMGEMASGLAHELNQPLAAIVNYASAALRVMRTSPEKMASAIDSLEAITEEGQRAGQIIRNVRDLVSRTEPTKAPVDVNEIVRMMVLLAKPEAARHGVAIRMQLGAGTGVVHASKIELEQVVFNLLRNAVEAMGYPESIGQPAVIISTRRTPVGSVEVEVEDCGPGIADDDIDQVFDPFFTTKVDGMGMGLSISRSIIEAHDGRLYVRPNADKGVTFGFTLPQSEVRLAA
ncbi:two-component system sensor kinase FixL [Panacagrimonas perspica]|uniref:histidine kinase n=2 Tax=Panacagrimonas perspica TaxID=381431 RepID=A0A4R7NYT7_9GAMM|nr:two-component system sensor kinase FixL [Panacagrimonas perspica]